MKCKLGIKTTAHLLCTGTKLASKDEFAVRSCSQENKNWGKKKKEHGKDARGNVLSKLIYTLTHSSLT